MRNIDIVKILSYPHQDDNVSTDWRSAPRDGPLKPRALSVPHVLDIRPDWNRRKTVTEPRDLREMDAARSDVFRRGIRASVCSTAVVQYQYGRTPAARGFHRLLVRTTDHFTCQVHARIRTSPTGIAGSCLLAPGVRKIRVSTAVEYIQSLPAYVDRIKNGFTVFFFPTITST